jgi:hypothetical protein
MLLVDEFLFDGEVSVDLREVDYFTLNPAFHLFQVLKRLIDLVVSQPSTVLVDAELNVVPPHYRPIGKL